MSNAKIVKHLATNPKAMMDFQAKGKLPTLREALETPLLRLLKKVPYRARTRIEGIRLSPKLGYQSNAEFRNAEMLFKWLGGYGQLGQWETLPSESMAIKTFNKALSLDDLKAHARSFPENIDYERNSRFGM